MILFSLGVIFVSWQKSEDFHESFPLKLHSVFFWTPMRIVALLFWSSSHDQMSVHQLRLVVLSCCQNLCIPLAVLSRCSEFSNSIGCFIWLPARLLRFSVLSLQEHVEVFHRVKGGLAYLLRGSKFMSWKSFEISSHCYMYLPKCTECPKNFKQGKKNPPHILTK